MHGNRTALKIDVLIVGTGPAGAASAALLGTYGVRALVINKYGWTAPTPRAHITNQRTMEIIRDLGLEAEAEQHATRQELMGENTYCTSLAGEELGRVKTWGNHPRRRTDFELASPTKMCDLPQHLLEPIFINAAAKRGTKVRFDTEYLDHEQDDKGVTVSVRDRLTGETYNIRCKYLIGADGANSKVVADAGLPLEGKMGVSGAINVHFDADLSRFVAHRPSVLYWVMQPGSSTGGLGIGLVRMVRPWNKWLAIWGYDIEQGAPEMTEGFAKEIVHNMIGDNSVPVTIEATSLWTVNDMFATSISKGRVFCMGDAIHRHPPTNGLGSNVSIQDAYNLAWKLALVLGGKAAPSLLSTYDPERTPVAKQTVKRANKSLGDFPPIFKALGLLDAKSPQEMIANMAARKAATPGAAEQRAALINAIDNTHYVYNAHGVEMNQRYDSAAIVSDGTPDPGFKRDLELYHEHSSRPGAPLPHAWLVTKTGHRISTLDLCGKGRFTLLTGIGGEAWDAAARQVRDAYGINLDAVIVGPGREYEDIYGDFSHLRETNEDGALLVRPDLIVGWRSKNLAKSAVDDLLTAFEKILGLSSKQRLAAE
ncbi:FAD-dependent monooxygenase [Bradyrhizobium sp. RD5-C2]|nr:FAD-dependent monooxygenase [Bradyrhizobium sp. RD5-C2]BAF64267.1 dichlorophenol hydroxylase [Bradyrhizobium sp. RD5-C2]GIQ78261.1 2,4-dichlorophenol 6-monooxygenase [Bradyrhizobium sp. RD5-C2]